MNGHPYNPKTRLSPWEIPNQQIRVQDTETRQEPLSEKGVGPRGRIQNLGPPLLNSPNINDTVITLRIAVFPTLTMVQAAPRPTQRCWQIKTPRF